MMMAATTMAQSKNPFNAADVRLTWQIVENPYANTTQARAKVTLVNKGAKPVPTKGWKIYFNATTTRSGGLDKNLLVDRVNGDLFILYPGSGFKTVATGDSISSSVLQSHVKDITDYPKGFYIVFDSEPEKGYPLLTDITNRVNIDKNEKALAEKIYHQNQLITDMPVANLSPILPTPVTYKRAAGSFKLTPQVKIINDPAFIKEAGYFKDELAKVFGSKPQTGFTEKYNVIVLQKGGNNGPEGYQLQVAPGRITITATNGSGIFYGLQSLKNLLPAAAWTGTQKNFDIPCINITDAPRFEHRAFMLDVARNFLPKSHVLKVIDLLSFYKFNVLHMHMVDDEGWRIEIPGLPELTQTGATRGHSSNELKSINPAYGSGPDTTNQAGSGYFSRQEYIEILRYANDRHIKVIPEIETPGHARAAIKAMNARYDRFMKLGKKAEAEQYLLRDINDKSVYRSVQGFSDNVLNVGQPSAYAFLEKIADELIAMYKEAGAPLETIHYGGDEVPAGVWEKSPVIADLMKKDSSIKNTSDLWFYYFGKINTMLKSKGLYLSGWEEIGLTSGVVNGKKRLVIDPRFANENFHTDVWNNLVGNEDLAYKLANAGYKVVLTNVTNLYLDLAYNTSFYERGQYWGGYVDLNKPFAFIPYNYYKNQKENEMGQPLKPGHFDGKEQLTEAGRRNIVGIQSPLWAEVITSPEKHEYLLLPKVLAVAERAWAPDPQWATEPEIAKSEALYNQAWAAFANKVSKTELPKLDHYAGGFEYRIPTPGFVIENGLVKANIQLPGFTIRYTTDGTEPDANSSVITDSLNYTPQLNLRAFNTEGRGGRTVKVIQ
ncbi:carbohydate-binding domain-containing protein [Mucilaginibacter sp. JRF]|nr:carbohydate-binding domain-containing protein [Mucilaginibacter sp. JRF]